MAGVSRRLTTSIACLLLASACSVPAPAESLAPSDTVVATASTAQIGSPEPPASGTSPSASPSIVPPGDPTAELTGRAVGGIATGGPDVVLRIGAEGFRLPENEYVIEVHGDRVLTGKRSGTEPPSATLVVRDLEGNVLREIEPGMQIPQTAVVRGDDLYFAGVDVTYDDQGLIESAVDRGAWVVHGGDPPRLILATQKGGTRYQAIERSPDGRTIGISRCGEDDCVTYFVGPDGHVTQLPKTLLLIAMTNDVALMIGAFSDITAFAVADGAELWHAETDGIYGDRYPTSDGTRIVNSIVEDAGDGDGNSQDQLRIEVIDALSGIAEQTVLLPTETSPTPWIAPSLSSDRYAALLGTILPNPDQGPHSVRVVDLQTGTLLDLQLTLGDVPG